MARRLARSYGARLYSTDTRTWVHRQRALDAGVAAAERFERLSPTERWRVGDGELFEMSLHDRRGPMVIDDVQALPPEPLIIAEGSTVPASVVSAGVAERSRVVWLLPTAEFQDAQLAAAAIADGPARLYRLLRHRAEIDVAHYDLPVLIVDGSRATAAMVGAVERAFSDALAAGPSATGADPRRRLLREMNEDIVAQVRGYHLRPWATGDPELVESLFACECGRPDCEDEVSSTVAVAAAGPLFAAGHG